MAGQDRSLHGRSGQGSAERHRTLLLPFIPSASFDRMRSHAPYLSQLLRESGVPPPLLSTNVNGVQDLIAAFEQLRVARDYQTPITVKLYVTLSLPVLVLFTAPYWASVLHEHPSQHPLIFFLCNVLWLLVLMLISLQSKLECPFGQDEDDINLDDFHLADIFEQQKRQILFVD